MHDRWAGLGFRALRVWCIASGNRVITDFSCWVCAQSIEFVVMAKAIGRRVTVDVTNILATMVLPCVVWHLLFGGRCAVGRVGAGNRSPR